MPGRALEEILIFFKGEETGEEGEKPEATEREEAPSEGEAETPEAPKPPKPPKPPEAAEASETPKAPEAPKATKAAAEAPEAAEAPKRRIARRIVIHHPAVGAAALHTMFVFAAAVAAYFNDVKAAGFIYPICFYELADAACRAFRPAAIFMATGFHIKTSLRYFSGLRSIAYADQSKYVM